jgi:chaperonin GroES
MAKSNENQHRDAKAADLFETVEPIGMRILIRKDEDKKQTKGGIQLPDNIEIPTITGRIVSISAEVEMSTEVPLNQYDKVLFNPKGAIPVDFEGSNRLFVVEVENVVAVFRKS